MKVLWICNMPLPGACKAFNIKVGMGGGWLYAAAKRIVADSQIDLYVCFADRKSCVLRKVYDGEMTHFAVPRRIHSFFVYDRSMEKYFDRIIQEVKPDIIHIHGTENTVGLSAMRVHPELPYIISLQGILTYISQYECERIPFWGRLAWNPISVIKRNSVGTMRRRHRVGAKNERKMLKGASYILGRTNFDKTFAQNIHPEAAYITCHEHLRDIFYQIRWNNQQCQQHVVLTGGSWSLKGLHIALQAMPDILHVYPDAQLRIIGLNSFSMTASGLLYLNGYYLYLYYLIHKLKLKEHVCFLGTLNASEVCEEMQKAHVFAFTSFCDNSPNMLGEAMMIGTPCVASYAGGVPDMIEHRKSGILYQYDAPYMMASAVKEIFHDDNLAQTLSHEGQKRAHELYNDDHIQELREIYEFVYREYSHD